YRLILLQMSVAESSKKQKERSVITLEKKVEIIKKKEENKNLTHTNLAKEYDIDRSTISNILQFHIIDEAVYKLFLELRSHNVPVSQDMLKTKALSIYEQLKNSSMEFPTTFEASNGWEDWLKWLDSQVNQSTILLTDNCSAHSSPKLQNIKLEFLLPNTTSVIQPCDASIIKNFKVNYRKLLVTKWIDEKKTKILLLEINLTTDTSNNNDIDELEQLLEELEMSYDYIKLSAEEYVEVDKHLQIMNIQTEESIVQDILKEQGLINNKNSNNKADDEKEKEIIDNLVSYNKGKKALEVVKKYLEQSQFATEDDIYLLRQIIKKAESFY
ncbi:14758_t:CDS:2, partial [Cetraspora pellucida]